MVGLYGVCLVVEFVCGPVLVSRFSIGEDFRETARDLLVFNHIVFLGFGA